MKKKYKVAVQLFGHMRTFEKCSPSLWHNILSQYDCDVFIHTWDSLNVQDKNNFNPDWQFNETIVNKINNLYQPKKLLIQSQNFDYNKIQGIYGSIEPKPGCISLFAIKYLLHSQKSVNELRIEHENQHNQKYDFVLFIRPDIFIGEKLVIENYIHHFEYRQLTSIHFPIKLHVYSYNNRHIMSHDTADLCFLTNPESANIIGKLFYNYDEYVIGIQQTFPKKPILYNNQLILHTDFMTWEYSFIEYIRCQGIAVLKYRLGIELHRLNNTTTYNFQKFRLGFAVIRENSSKTNEYMNVSLSSNITYEQKTKSRQKINLPIDVIDL